MYMLSIAICSKCQAVLQALKSAKTMSSLVAETITPLTELFNGVIQCYYTQMNTLTATYSTLHTEQAN